MKMKKALIGSLIVCSALAVTLKLIETPQPTKAANAHPIASDAAAYDELDAYVRQQMDRLNIPGVSLAVVEGDEIVHLRGFGHARPGGEAPSPQTPFPIGSLTKSFTALAVMQRVEAGAVELDAPVQQYLPWFRVADPEASAQITVRHLLNQTSGLSTASGWIPLADFDDRPDATERQARALATSELSHPVGSAFEYSNVNYNLLGLIVEAVSGQAYADYVEEHIFAPLEMNHSTTSPAEVQEDDLAVGHRYWFWFPVAAPDLPMPRGSLPSGQLISTAEDMGRYMIALLNDGRYGDARILSSESRAALHRGVAESVEMGVSMGRYGMGWYVSETAGTRVVWHTGMVPAFSSYMALLPEQEKGVVLLINADHFMMNPILSEMGGNVAALLAGEEPESLQLGFLPWMMRSLLLVPILQVVGVVATSRQLRAWRENPTSRPHGLRKWGLHLLLPLLPNLGVALSLLLILSPLRGFWRLFMPDLTWTAIVSGSFAGLWTVLRTALTFRALRDED